MNYLAITGLCATITTIGIMYVLKFKEHLKDKVHQARSKGINAHYNGYSQIVEMLRQW